MTFGQRLRLLRDLAGYGSDAALEDAAGLTRGNFSRWAKDEYRPGPASRAEALVFKDAHPTAREVSGFTHYLRGGELRGDMALLAGRISKGKMREIINRPVAEEVVP